jgi:hypothetical protein
MQRAVAVGRGPSRLGPGRRGRDRERARDLRSDGPALLGGLFLATGVLLSFVVVVGLALSLGVAQTWPAVAWVALAALALLLLSLELLFVRDYLRWRRAVAVYRRG